MNKAVFLDRDGVINVDTGYVYREDDFQFTDGIFSFCRLAQRRGYLLIVITNQAGIGRGYYTEDDFNKINQFMLETFNGCGVEITDVYHCPYHPKGIGKYKMDSPDRKPNPGMILKAGAEHGIDLGRSVLIGDKDSDIEAGRRAGVGRLFFLEGRYSIESSTDVILCKTLFEIERIL